MKPTRRSVFIQLLIMILGNLCFVVHQFWRDTYNGAILYSVLISFMIIVAITAYYEIDYIAYKESMLSFRGVCIMFAIIINTLCDISRHFLVPSDTEPLFTIIVDDIAFFLLTMIMLAADSAPRVTNFTRLMGPLCTVVALTVYVAYTMTECIHLTETSNIAYN